MYQNLENRIHALEAVNTVDPILGTKSDSKKSDHVNDYATSKPKAFVNTVATSDKKTKGGGRACNLCPEEHPLFKFPELKKSLAVEKRSQAVRLKLCFNCLIFGHAPGNCKNKTRCMAYGRPHHTSMHDAFSEHQRPAPIKQPALVGNIPAAAQAGAGTDQLVAHASVFKAHAPCKSALLATTLVRIYAPDGRFLVLRALFATSSFITSRSTRKLNLRELPTCVDIEWLAGVGSGKSTCATSY